MGPFDVARSIMPEIGNTGVSFDVIAREWRCKYTGPAGESTSLKAANDLLISQLEELKQIGDVKRVVCGGCLDFKVVISAPAEKFGEWEGNKFAPEESFISKLSAIEGISAVETQTYT